MQENKSATGIDPKKYYTVQEAADFFGVHRSTIWHWAKSQRLHPHLRVVNNRTEFLGADLLKLSKRI